MSGKKKVGKAEKAKRHAEYLREKKKKQKERKNKLKTTVKKKKK